MMPGTTAMQVEPHTWRGEPEVFDASGNLSSFLGIGVGVLSAIFGGRGSIAFKANYLNMRATFAGAGSVVFKATNLNMSATFVGAGQFFLPSTQANLQRKGSVAWTGAGSLASDAKLKLASSAAWVGTGDFLAIVLAPPQTYSGEAALGGAGSLSALALDSDTAAWVAGVVAAGGAVSNARKILVDNLVRGLKTDGLWNKIDRLWLFAAEDVQGALVDLRNVSSATRVATNPTFTANEGFTGNASGYIETNLNASTGGPWKFLRDDAHWSFWNLTNSITSLSNQQIHGSNQSSVGMQIFSNALFSRVNEAGGSVTPPASIGQFIGSRDNSSTHNNYFNGSFFALTSAASVAVANNTFRVFFADSGNKSSVKCAAFSVGGHLDSGADASNFYERVRVYMSAVGLATQAKIAATLGGAGSLSADGTIV